MENLTPQQSAAIEAAATTNRNLLIKAVAGSGKTFTLFEMVKSLHGDVSMNAFSAKISQELTRKADAIRGSLKCNLKTGTIHSACNAVVRRAFPKTELLKGNQKIDKLMETLYNPQSGTTGVPYELKAFVRKAYSVARQWGAGVLPEFPLNRQEAWFALVEHFELENTLFDPRYQSRESVDVEELVHQGIELSTLAIKAGKDIAERYIDFEDMIYLVLALNLQMTQYDHVLVDECQDQNATKRSIIRKMVKPEGRAIFVGDAYQAIFGFTGADSESLDNIQKEFNTQVLPLTYSFRCAQEIVRFAKTWMPDIEAAPNAPEGFVLSIDDKEFFSMPLTIDDAILCRNNAPLVDLFFRFMKLGVPAHIEGKDIGEELVKIVNRYPKIKSIPALVDKLTDYRDREVQKWEAKGKEEKAAKIADSVDAILAVASNVDQGLPVQALRDKISAMFQDADGNQIPTLTLTTIHKSKGREWTRVFWYGRNRWQPSPYARKAWQVQAEKNLQGVAATRAKLYLYDVGVAAPSKRFK